MVISGRSLGTNLSGIAQYSSQDALIDYFQASRTWLPQKFNVFDTGEQSKLKLDANGWVTSLPNANSTRESYRWVSTILFPFGASARPGRYIVLYEGDGHISYSLAGQKIEAESVLGRDVINFDRV